MICILLQACATGQIKDDLKLYLPSGGNIKPIEQAKTATDQETLFAAINGGAESFIELGFTRAIFQKYEIQSVRKVDLEIYQMSSEAAAQTIYQKKKVGAEGGLPAMVGQEGTFHKYYLFFYRGVFFVSIAMNDVEGTELKDLLPIAKLADEELQ